MLIEKYCLSLKKKKNIVYLCILIEKYGQSMLSQYCKLLNKSSIVGWREYKIIQQIKFN